jgi:hypothetical protein
MPKAINLSFSDLDFFSSSTSSIFHFKPVAFFSKNISTLEILSSLDSSGMILSDLKGKQNPMQLVWKLNQHPLFLHSGT